jgi:poly(hydroxyalkanoate) granule-associated protein
MPEPMPARETMEAQIMSTGKSRGKQDGYQFANLIRASAHEIWLAGLGAYSRANKEGARFFESLVELGDAVEKKARDQVARPFRAAEKQVEGARSAVNETWDRLEMLFDRRVARALHSLQIPTQRDVAELTKRVAKLQGLVEQLSGSTPPGRQAARQADRKSRGKTATAKRTKKAPARKKRIAKKAPARTKRVTTAARKARKTSAKAARP